MRNTHGPAESDATCLILGMSSNLPASGIPSASCWLRPWRRCLADMVYQGDSTGRIRLNAMRSIEYDKCTIQRETASAQHQLVNVLRSVLRRYRVCGEPKIPRLIRVAVLMWLCIVMWLGVCLRNILGNTRDAHVMPLQASHFSRPQS